MHKTVNIIGISGTFASGKDSIAAYLAQDRGYTHISTGDMVRKVAQAKYGSVERPVLHKTATELRYKNGAGALVLEAIKEPKPIVVSGIRTLGEAKALLDVGGTLIYVDAPIEIRYERVKSRNRDKESELTMDQFRANEEAEMYSGPNDEDFNIRGIKDLADVVIDNTLTLQETFEKVQSTLGLK